MDISRPIRFLAVGYTNQKETTTVWIASTTRTVAVTTKTRPRTS